MQLSEICPYIQALTNSMHKSYSMDKTIELDDALLREVQEATGEQNEREAVEHILKRFIEARRKHSDLLDLIGKVRFRDDYDPRAIRFSGHDSD
jgi:Arc/MetJ family transcription regulator